MKSRTLSGAFCAVTIPLLFLASCSKAQDEKVILPGAFKTGNYLNLLKNKQVGIVANHTSLINKTHLCDSLLKLGIRIHTIFAPEHGFLGRADAGTYIGNEHFGGDSINIVSLYGQKKKPESSDIKHLDIMVFDIQDVGVRFYTYLSTLHNVMEACAENQIPLLVLDRPNPIGFYIDGPVLEKKYSSFVGLHPVPIVVGMTIGEYALMINGEYWLDDSVQCQLSVIPCTNYDHNSRYILPVSPSPNLTSMASIYLYPSLALFEGTIATVGKGTDFPFQLIGHPDFSDKRFSFIPASRKGTDLHTLFEGKTCYGIDLRDIPADSLKILQTIDLSYLIRSYNSLNYGDKFFNDFFLNLAGTDELEKQIIEGRSEDEIRASWQPGLEKYKKIRAKYLLYPDFSE
jgi:uncharacterized protein YbbC (DUF1343 family)